MAREEEKSVSKITYKLLIISLKYLPYLLALIDVIHTILSYYDINGDILRLIGGISMLSLLFIYLASYAFRFCELHRLPIYYIVTSNLIATYDAYVGIPCTDKQLFCTYLIVAGLFIIGYVIAYKKIIKLDYR